MKDLRGPSSLLLLGVALSFLWVEPTIAQDVQPDVVYQDYHDTSIPLRDAPQIAPPSVGLQVIPLRPGPTFPVVNVGPQPQVQTSAIGSPLVGTSGLFSFDGISATGFIPPDPNASVGATQIVETVNVSYQVFNKAGTSLLGPNQLSSIWAANPPFGGVCQLGPSFSDPVVLYDKQAGRWFVGVIASSNSFASGTICMAVSTTSDATGSYNRYAFSFNNLPDYPKFGVWPDGYYASYNMYQNGTTFVGAWVCAYNRSAMLVGSSAAQICFQQNVGFSRFLVIYLQILTDRLCHRQAALISLWIYAPPSTVGPLSISRSFTCGFCESRQLDAYCRKPIDHYIQSTVWHLCSARRN